MKLAKNIVISTAFVVLLPSLAKENVSKSNQIKYRTEKINGVDIFYREAGSPKKPTIVLLHGFPTSSHMFRDLIPLLSKKFHLIAPDYPGYGNSSMPSVNKFDYTFDSIAKIVDTLLERKKIEKYILYLMDYGAPIGYRIAVKHPERVEGLIIQNGNAYEEGLASKFWDPVKKFWKNRSPETTAPLVDLVSLKTTKSQYTNGARALENISPDTWNMDQLFLDRPGNSDIQLALLYDYKNNVPLYPTWQAYLKKHQPPTLLVWGKNDAIFPPEGAYPYKKDLKNLEFHLLDTGHFALEEDGEVIANYILDFFG
jgi:pimeloyl-ACP methyl ester carboxylesterase